MTIQGRGPDAVADLLHVEIAEMVRLLVGGQIEDYNDRLDGFCDAMGEHLYRSLLEIED